MEETASSMDYLMVFVQSIILNISRKRIMCIKKVEPEREKFKCEKCGIESSNWIKCYGKYFCSVKHLHLYEEDLLKIKTFK